MPHSIMPGEIECDHDHEEQEPVTDNAENNTSPRFTHSRLLSLQRKAFCFLLFHLDRIDHNFEMRTCTKGHHSACQDHDGLARAGIPPLAWELITNRKLAKARDGDRLALLKGGLEEFKNPLQQYGRLWFRDPGFLMNPLGNIRLSHFVSFRLWQEVLAFHSWR